VAGNPRSVFMCVSLGPAPSRRSEIVSRAHGKGGICIGDKKRGFESQSLLKQNFRKGGGWSSGAHNIANQALSTPSTRDFASASASVSDFAVAIDV
jgi:hypothetical protein